MIKAKQKTMLMDIVAQANFLNRQHDEFVAQFVTRANDELYVLLAEMMVVCEEIWNSGCEEFLIKNLRQLLREQWNIKTQKNTSTTTLVVKYITRGIRQVVHGYAKVIDAAKVAGVSSCGLVEYIKSKGGIDAVRKSVVCAAEKNQTSKQQQKVLANLTQMLRAKDPLGELSLSNTRNRFAAICSDVEFSLSLSMVKDGKEQVIASIYPSSTILGQCLDLYVKCLHAVASDDGTGKFHSICKDYGLNMDVVHRWMRDNNVSGSSEALALLRATCNEENEVAANDEYAVAA